MNNKEIVDEIRSTADRWFTKNMPDINRSQACFYWAVLTAYVLADKGQSAWLKAGSLSWPRINLKMDDGKMMTHFSYMWEPQSPTTMCQIAAGLMPEMHVWVVLPDKRELVDVTTRFLKEQCETVAKMKWLGPNPPDFLWCPMDRLPKGVIYTASQSALDYLRWAHGRGGGMARILKL